MIDREKVIKEYEDYVNSYISLITSHDYEFEMHKAVLALLKEQEPIKPTINEYGEAYCICGENVGIIPSSKNLPKILSKYCSECGRRMKWDECVK